MHQPSNPIEYLESLSLRPDEAPHYSGEKFFKKQAGFNEIVLIARIIKKVNKRNREQERGIIVSNEYVYNLSGKQIKRKIALSKVYAVTVSRTGPDFVLHVPEEYDYRYKTPEHRDILLYYLCIALKLNGLDGLRLFIVDDEDLSQFTLNEKVNSRDKAYLLHPKLPFKLLTPESFQLNYINLHNQNKKIQVLFVRDPLLLKVSLQDLPKKVIIGRGAFGSIYLIHQKKQTQGLLALKTINRKQFDIDFDLMEFLLKSYQTEPFITPLELCILQEEKIHFFFKFMKGGDLYQHLRDVNSFTELQAKFIFSQIALGLSSLHERGIIFGDLKPENVLMDENGFIGLTDFGFGKLRIYQEYKRMRSINTTLEYCAPEYLRNGDLTRMADWYSLGILLYELLIGIPPFYHPTSPEIMIRMIQKGELHFPRNFTCSPDCQDMIKKLLQQDSSQRLGFTSDFKEIQNHSWLTDVNWLDLKAKRIDLPYKPSHNEQEINDGYFNMEQLQEEDRNW